MTTGSIDKDYTILLPGVIGRYGLYTHRAWNGADSPKIQRTKSAKKVELVQVEVLVWKFGKQVRVSHTFQQRVYTPRDPPPKRALFRDDHTYQTDFNSRFYPVFVFRPIRDGRSFTPQGAGYYADCVADNFSANNQIALLGKLREAVAGSDFNAGVALGESRQTVKLIADSAKKLAKAFLLTKKGNLRQAAVVLTGQDPGRKVARTSKSGHLANRAPANSSVGFRPSDAVASNWLQLQYGWLPLLMDVKNGAEFLAHHYNTPRKTTLRVQLSQKTGVSATSGPCAPSSQTFLTRRRIKATLTETDVTALAGLTDPLSVAWELVPYSFIVDWFIPVGNWLSARALSNAITGTFVVSTLKKGEVKGLTLLDNDGANSVPEYRSTSGSFVRELTSSLSVPKPEFKTLAKALSMGHLQNGIALLQQAFSRR